MPLPAFGITLDNDVASDVLQLADEVEPGWTSRTEVRLVMPTKDTAYDILINLNAEGQRNLLGNSGGP